MALFGCNCDIFEDVFLVMFYLELTGFLGFRDEWKNYCKELR